MGNPGPRTSGVGRKPSPLKTMAWALVTAGTLAGLTAVGTGQHSAEAAVARPSVPLDPGGRQGAAPHDGAVATTSAAQAARHYYGGAYQYASTLGTSANLTIHQPKIEGTDLHSLAAVTAQSRDHKQTVEVGWTVDRKVNGDTLPHLFVYRWVNGTESCYNGCGFVSTSDKVRPGTRLTAGDKRPFAVKHHKSKWWVGYNGVWFGYYPDSLWGGKFTRAGLLQWYGGVATPRANPCTDMGSGKWPNSSSAASISGIKFFDGSPVKIALNKPTDARKYSAQLAGNTALRYGGPGAC